jgi:thioredoxin reductase
LILQVAIKEAYRMTIHDVTIIGAGPYGLSAGAFLKSKGMGVRVFGKPMEFWAEKMPKGMLLRSPREASNIADPMSAFTLEAYEAAVGIAPVTPLPLETFVQYGKWFQQQLRSELDTTSVASINQDGNLFRIALESGESVTSRKVVVAAGVGPFNRKPAVFAQLGKQHASHCYEGTAISDLAGKRVAVVGAGQSALESAALLHEAGADVEIIARIEALRWIGMHKWLHQLGPLSSMMYSKHDIGPAGISRLVATPNIVARIPLGMRDKIRKRAVRSAGSRWLPARLSSVKISTGRSISRAELIGDEVALTLDDGSSRRVDHVLLGTGYDVDISRYSFLPTDLVSKIRQFDGYPILDSGFCASIPGLHFIGAPAARSFGPLLYFVTGTDFTSRQLTSRMVRRRAQVGARALNTATMPSS